MESNLILNLTRGTESLSGEKPQVVAEPASNPPIPPIPQSDCEMLDHNDDSTPKTPQRSGWELANEMEAENRPSPLRSLTVSPLALRQTPPSAPRSRCPSDAPVLDTVPTWARYANNSTEMNAPEANYADLRNPDPWLATDQPSPALQNHEPDKTETLYNCQRCESVMLYPVPPPSGYRFVCNKCGCGIALKKAVKISTRYLAR
jgi:hypothetical protein